MGWSLDEIFDYPMFEMDKKVAQSIWSQFSHDYRGVDMAVLDGY